MIAQLTGTVAHVAATSLVLDVGGVGMQVQATPDATRQWRTGDQVTVWTHLVVREDSLTLFGFPSARERDTFATLQGVQGVGPRLAQAMLAVHSPERLATVIANGDAAALQQVPGIGAKVAARLLLELGGKISLDADGGQDDARGQVIAALEGLGWTTKAATDAVADVADGPVTPESVPEVLKSALQQMGATRGSR